MVLWWLAARRLRAWRGTSAARGGARGNRCLPEYGAVTAQRPGGERNGVANLDANHHLRRRGSAHPGLEPFSRRRRHPDAMRRRHHQQRLRQLGAQRHAVRRAVSPAAIAPRGRRLVEPRGRQSIRARRSGHRLLGTPRAGSGRHQLQSGDAIQLGRRGRAARVRRSSRDRSGHGRHRVARLARRAGVPARVAGAI